MSVTSILSREGYNAPENLVLIILNIAKNYT
jgi:hypothetical protein